MKKKLIAQLLVLVLVLSLLPTFALAAEEPVYAEVNATAAESVASGIETSSSPLRGNADNALYAPDALQTAGEDKFASLRNFESATYTFHAYDGDGVMTDVRTIVNYRGTDADAKPDLSLIEVTWGTGWHVEAVDIYLVNAKDADGADLGDYHIGRAYNKVGVDKGLAGSGDDGFKVTTQKIGNHQYTHIYFPDNVESADAIKLVDATTDENTPVATSNTYNAKDDGFDLDAVTAWYVKSVPVTAKGTLSLTKLVSNNGVETPGEGFTFAAYAAIDDAGEPVGEAIDRAVSDQYGSVVFAENEAFVVGTDYYIFEELTEEQAKIYSPANPYVVLTATNSPDEAEEVEFLNILHSGSLVIGKQLGDQIDDSVTGAGIDSSLSNNWFEYTPLKPLKDNPVQTFDLIAGRDRRIVGSFTVSYDVDTNEATVSYSLNRGLSYNGTANFSFKLGEGTSKGKDASLLNTVAPGQQAYAMNGNSMTVSLDEVKEVKGKKVNVISPEIPNDVPIIVYLHLGVGGYVNAAGADGDTEFFVKVTGPSYPYGEVFSFTANQAARLNGLIPGYYSIEEVMDAAGTQINGRWPYEVTYPEGSGVTVVPGGESNLTVSNREREVEASGTFAVDKWAEGEDGYYEPTEGFIFAAYAEIDEYGNPVGSAIARATSDLYGRAVFPNLEEFIVGETYYVFEELTDEQAALYEFGGQNLDGYIEIVAVTLEELSAEEYEAPVFYNDLKLGTLTVTKKAEAYNHYLFGRNTVTGGWDDSEGAVQGSWQRPVYIDVAAILAGEDYVEDLVAGSKLTPVGKYRVSADGDGGLVIDLDYDFYYPGLESDAITMVAFGNWNRGTSQSGINGDNANKDNGLYMTDYFGESVYISAVDVAKALGDGDTYLYIHSGIGAQTVVEDITDDYEDEVFYFTVFDEANGLVDRFSLVNGGSYTVEDLEDGFYTVVEDASGWTVSYSVVGGIAQVFAGEDTPVTVYNELIFEIPIV